MEWIAVVDQYVDLKAWLAVNVLSYMTIHAFGWLLTRMPRAARTYMKRLLTLLVALLVAGTLVWIEVQTSSMTKDSVLRIVLGTMVAFLFHDFVVKGLKLLGPLTRDWITFMSTRQRRRLKERDHDHTD